MKLFVLGATGHTGSHIIDLALARSHHVTAFVRSPDKIKRQHALLAVLEGNPRNSAEVARAMSSHDAVLSALGVRPPQAFRPHTLVQECAASTASAMKTAGVERLVMVSAAVLFPQRGLSFAFFRRLLKYIADDLRGAEAIIRATSLEWTITRPPRLTESSDLSYRTCVGGVPKGAASMSFRGVAKFMLDVVEHHSYLQEIVGLAR